MQDALHFLRRQAGELEAAIEHDMRTGTWSRLSGATKWLDQSILTDSSSGPRAIITGGTFAPTMKVGEAARS